MNKVSPNKEERKGKRKEPDEKEEGELTGRGMSGWKQP